jgi:hypothetical protein
VAALLHGVVNTLGKIRETSFDIKQPAFGDSLLLFTFVIILQDLFI